MERGINPRTPTVMTRRRYKQCEVGKCGTFVVALLTRLITSNAAVPSPKSFIHTFIHSFIHSLMYGHGSRLLN